MWLIASGASIFDSFACLFVTLSQQKASSGFVSLLSYLVIVYGYLSDQILFHT